jgi:hypothetical protein
LGRIGWLGAGDGRGVGVSLSSALLRGGALLGKVLKELGYLDWRICVLPRAPCKVILQ